MDLPLFKYEKQLLDNGIELVAGVDEVGRGPLAGPMVVCAAMLDIKKLDKLINESNTRNNDVSDPVLEKYKKVNDSKKVSEKNRNILSEFLKSELISYSIVEVSNHEIDAIGIGSATQKLFYKAIKSLKTKPQYILTDTFEIKNITKDTQTNIKHGDTLSISIAAASIVAKVYRDTLMLDMHQKYPQYGFDHHKGYGTAKHIETLKKYGPCEIHRFSFEPIKSISQMFLR